MRRRSTLSSTVCWCEAHPHISDVCLHFCASVHAQAECTGTDHRHAYKRARTRTHAPTARARDRMHAGAHAHMQAACTHACQHCCYLQSLDPLYACTQSVDSPALGVGHHWWRASRQGHADPRHQERTLHLSRHEHLQGAAWLQGQQRWNGRPLRRATKQPTGCFQPQVLWQQQRVLFRREVPSRAGLHIHAPSFNCYIISNSH